MNRMPVYDDLRHAIDASGKTRYRLWQETGVSQAQLSQFMAGSKGLSVEALEKLAECLDLEVIARPKSCNRGKAPTSTKAGRKER